jgi:hypothetical protein
MPTTKTVKPPCTHREVTPIRLCSECGAYLRSFHDGDKCDPCEKGEVKQPTEAEVWDALAGGDCSMRDAIFDAVVELQEAA